MMNLEHLVPKRRWQAKMGKRFWLLVAAVVLVVIVATAVPLAVLLPRNSDKPPVTGSIMLPLYIYPHDNTTWGPVYEALARHPNLNFTVVVNPHSGPGDKPAPNEQYTAAITQLSTYPNAQLLGYVRTGYATRNMSDVLDEISVYAGWSSRSGSLTMHGIFLDEAPHTYSEAAVEFMRTVGQEIKGIEGLGEPKTIVHNPGTLPDPEFFSSAPDITVIFEQSYSTWTSTSQNTAAFVTNTNTTYPTPTDRSSYAIMVHSVPDTLKGDDLQNFVDGLEEIGQHLFVTSNKDNYYESFAGDWGGFVDLVTE